MGCCPKCKGTPNWPLTLGPHTTSYAYFVLNLPCTKGFQKSCNSSPSPGSQLKPSFSNLTLYLMPFHTTDPAPPVVASNEWGLIWYFYLRICVHNHFWWVKHLQASFVSRTRLISRRERRSKPHYPFSLQMLYQATTCVVLCWSVST